jgi:molybdopterin synthase catalytic subunit
MPAAPPLIDVQILETPVQPVSVEPFPDSCGAECVFLGRSRLETHPEHGALVNLTYEAYAPLARRVLAELARQAVERHACRAVRIHHAVGDVPVGAASVLVQVACGHRDEAFAACRFLIDRLKATAPIWKREHWADGATWSTGGPVEPLET